MADWQAMDGLQVAIDGPSGSGKGTIATMIAEALALPVLDTGLLYRFTGWRAVEAGADLESVAPVVEALQQALPKLDWRPEGIFFDGGDCTSLLRSEDVGAYASKVAAMPEVRSLLLDVQRRLATHGCVMDGRDIGSVVLPDAQAKFFLTASPRERARRRWAQLHGSNSDVSIDAVVAELKARDERDAGRDCAPLEQARGAIRIDSTTMRIDEVVDRMLAVMERRQLIRPAETA
jgi:cytidylate kinase